MAKTYVDYIRMGGVTGYFRETLSGAGAPTASTEGFVGLRYYDTEAKAEYICTSTEGGYTWEPYTAGGGGISPVLSVSDIAGGHRITITDADGVKTVDVMDGRGIVSIVRTSGTGAAGTTDTYTITYTDGTTSAFTVYNGADGTAGGGITEEDKAAIAQQAAALVNISGKLDKSGGTMTGELVAQNNTNYTVAQVRNDIILPDGEELPTASNGDFCWFYEV